MGNGASTFANYPSLVTGLSIQEMTMLKHITFFSTLIGFGFLMGVLSGTIVGAI
jgi:hypothetical protein